MQAAVPAVFPVVGLIFSLILGGGIPLGVPPLPEDPLLARIAPEQCVYYVSSAGMAAPDPRSNNQVEQLLAEPEVAQFIAEIHQQVVRAVRQKAAAEGPEAAALAEDAAGWVKILLTRPAAVFVSRVALGPQGPDLQAGAVVNVGEDVAKLKATLEKYQEGLLRGKAQPVEIGDQTWHRLQFAPTAPPITWGVKGKYLIAGLGENTIAEILNRARGTPPSWLTALRQQLPVERPSMITYVNLKSILETFGPMAGGPKVQQVLEAVGLGNVTSLASVAGLDKEGYVSRTLLALDGQPAGVLNALTAGSLSPQELDCVPRDATLAIAARLSVADLFETVLAAAEKIDPRAREEMARAIGDVERELDINLPSDLLKPLGDAWRLYNSPAEGGLVLTGLTAVVSVKDHSKLAATHASLLARAKKELEPDAMATSRRPRPQIQQIQFAGQDIYFFDSRDKEFPLAPAWCLTEKELVISLFPQGVKAYLSRGEDRQALTKAAQVAEALSGPNPPVAMVYMDNQALFDLVYPFMPMFAQVVVSELAREGIDVHVGILPSAAAIRRHLRPGVITVGRTPAGIETVSRQSIPGGSIATTVPLGTALLLPAVQSAREAARRTASMNNLKQIGLALIMHENSRQKFPPAYTTDKEGKPLLSWRVAILPYVEQAGLYEQFRQDEPWDSDHNKKLIPLMPRLFQRPGSVAGPGKTNYLTVRGEKTAFPGKESTRFADITDGASNTVMAVEVPDARAVVWTRPDDYEYDDKDPAAGLLEARPRGFNAVFCDGSVRFLSQTIDPQVLKAMFTRNGAEAVDANR